MPCAPQPACAILLIAGLALVTGAGIQQPAQAQAVQEANRCAEAKWRLAECEQTNALTRNCATAVQSGPGSRLDYGASLPDPNSGFTATHELARTLGFDSLIEVDANGLPTFCRRGDSQSNEIRDAGAPENFERIDRLKRKLVDPSAEEF